MPTSPRSSHRSPPPPNPGISRLFYSSTLLGSVYPAYVSYNTVLNPDENTQRYLLMFW